MITNKNFAKGIHNMKPSAPEINTKLEKSLPGCHFWGLLGSLFGFADAKIQVLLSLLSLVAESVGSLMYLYRMDQ